MGNKYGMGKYGTGWACQIDHRHLLPDPSNHMIGQALGRKTAWGSRALSINLQRVRTAALLPHQLMRWSTS